MEKITRRKFLEDVGKGISFAALAPYLSSCEFLNEDDLPNIVIIFTDDLGYADIGAFGAKGYSTPNLDKMAKEGMIFTDFHAATAVCSASRAALLTGCYSERVSIRGALNHSATIGLNPNEENIARLLKKKNYKTGIIGKWHLGHHKEFLPLQQGFDEFYGLPYSNDMWPVGYDGKPLVEDWKASYPELKFIEGNESSEPIRTLQDQDKITTKITERAVDFINRNSKNKFFLYLAHPMPHVPLGVSEKFKGKSEQGMFGDVIMEIDWSVGEVMKTLKGNGIEENTLVIFTSDNGPWLNYGNHAGSADPLREGKGTMWEGGNRVPCVVKWPSKIKPNTKIDNLTSTIDILPTIAEITKSNLPKNKIDGVSILPLFLNDKNANPRDEFWYYYDYDLIAVRKNEWKLYFPCIQRSYEGMEPGMDGYPGPTWQKKMDYELFNLNDDIEEQNNILDKHSDIVESLKKIGEKARYELGDRLTGIKGKENRPPGRIGEDRVKFENHLGVGKKIELKHSPHKRYILENQSLLLDGWKGSYDYNDGYWIGFEGSDFEAILDLGIAVSLSSIAVSFLENQSSWIFQPEKIDFFVSSDNINFKPITKYENKVKPNMLMEAKDYQKSFQPIDARYVKVSAKNILECPAWHPGKGGKAWLFVDEIVIK